MGEDHRSIPRARDNVLGQFACQARPNVWCKFQGYHFKSMQRVSSGQECGTKRDPTAWGRSPLMMASPLKEGYKRRNEDMREGVGKIGERVMRVVRKTYPGKKGILLRFHKVGSLSQYHFGQKGIKRKRAKDLWSFASKTCITIFRASHCWLFLTLNTNKLGSLTQILHLIGPSHHKKAHGLFIALILQAKRKQFSLQLTTIVAKGF